MINQEKVAEKTKARITVVRGFKGNASGIAPTSMPTRLNRNIPGSQSEWSVHSPGKRWFTWCAATPPRSPLKTDANQQIIAGRDASGDFEPESQIDRTKTAARNTLEISQSTIAIMHTETIKGGIPPA